MSKYESILGDISEPTEHSEKSSKTSQSETSPKQNNVTEFNSQPARSTKTPTANTVKGSTTSSTGGGTGAATATARSLYDQAKETAGQAYEAVTDKAATKLDEQKSTLSGGLSTVADSVRQVGENLNSSTTESGLAEAAAKYTNTAAGKIEDIAGYFENKNVREMARDLEGFARRNPAVFFGAAFGLGVLVARFLKSTPPSFDATAKGRAFANTADASHQLPATGRTTETPDFSSNKY